MNRPPLYVSKYYLANSSTAVRYKLRIKSILLKTSKRLFFTNKVSKCQKSLKNVKFWEKDRTLLAVPPTPIRSVACSELNLNLMSLIKQNKKNKYLFRCFLILGLRGNSTSNVLFPNSELEKMGWYLLPWNLEEDSFFYLSHYHNIAKSLMFY